MDKKFFSFLGLARKAGKIVLGYDNIVKRQKNIKLLILSNEAVERTKRNINSLNKPVINIDLSKKEFGKLMGAGEVSVVAVTDNNFAEQLNIIAKRSNE